MSVSRREFIERGAAAGLVAGARGRRVAYAAPWVRRAAAAEPVVIRR